MVCHIRSSNPPSNPALLDALVKDFLARDFDVRHLIRTICNSRTYQLSARTNLTNAEDRTNFSHVVPRRLGAEQLLDTLARITGVRESFRARIPGQHEFHPAVGRVPDPAMEPRSGRRGVREGAIAHALHAAAGKAVHAMAAHGNPRACVRLAQSWSPSRVCCRVPSGP